VDESPHIGTLNEGSLHAALKERYSEAGDHFEVALDGFVIDIRRADLLIEIQTVSFASMGNKFDHLLGSHNMLLVHPIAVQTYLERPGAKARRSPKRGSIFSIFDELVSIPTLLDHPNLTLDVVLVSVTKAQVADPKMRRGRGGFRTVDRALREVFEVQRFESSLDLLRLVPTDLPMPFTTAHLASGANVGRDVAQKMAYCFRSMGLFQQVGHDRAGKHYRFTPGS